MMAEAVDHPDMLQHLSVAANQTEESYFDLNNESQSASMDVDSQ